VRTDSAFVWPGGVERKHELSATWENVGRRYQLMLKIPRWSDPPTTFTVDATDANAEVTLIEGADTGHCIPQNHPPSPDCSWKYDYTDGTRGTLDCGQTGDRVGCRIADVVLEDGRRTSGWIHAAAR
jgi:hypothetical protein